MTSPRRRCPSTMRWVPRRKAMATSSSCRRLSPEAPSESDASPPAGGQLVSGAELWSVADIARRVRAGEINAVVIVDATLARIEKHDGELGAYLPVSADKARQEAIMIDATRA